MINNKTRTAIFLTLHLTILATIFALPYFGVSFQTLLIIATAVFSSEIMYLVFFSKAKISKVANKLNEVEKEVVRVREESVDSERIHRELLYIGHQLKSIQTEMDVFKRSGIFKINGNGHHKSAHV